MRNAVLVGGFFLAVMVLWVTSHACIWIGMAASVAGGYVATEGPRLECCGGVLHVDPHFDAEGCAVGAVAGNLLVMRVPASAGPAAEGQAILNEVLEQLLPQLRACCYAIE